MNGMKLTEPSEEYASRIAAYRQAFLDSGDSMDGCGPLRIMADPLEWIEFSRRLKVPETVPPKLAQATQYMFVREDDGKIAGMIQLRHRFNAYLEKYGGHIGYSVAPDERRKGYASAMLRAVLPECRRIGLDRILITCNDTNEGSRRTILSCGGVYESSVFEPDEGVTLERYWIDLTRRPEEN